MKEQLLRGIDNFNKPSQEKSGLFSLSYRSFEFDFDVETRKIKKGGCCVVLTETRSELLSILIESVNGCVGRDELCQEFWDGVDLDIARPRLSNLIHFTKHDLGILHSELAYSLGYVEESKKVKWGVSVK